MKWRGRRGSGNIEDRRGMRVSRGAVGGGLGTLLIIIAALVLDVDPGVVLESGGDPGATGPPTAERAPVGSPEDEMGRFVDVVLADTEDTWNRIFARSGTDYEEPTLVLFEEAVRSACGTASSAVGPFYCPGDQQVYLDLSFFRQLRERFGAPGEFAQAYVIAHEVGHHVQNITGDMDRLDGSGETGPESTAVRVELQADCYAGIWAHFSDAAGYVEPGDLNDALNAAAAIGDDKIQERTQGTVVPESFTHGTAEQRARWFRRGYESGDPADCNTFDGAA